MTTPVTLSNFWINVSKWLLKNRDELNLEVVQIIYEDSPALAIVEVGRSGGLVVVNSGKAQWVSRLWYFLRNTDDAFLKAATEKNLFSNGLFSEAVSELVPNGNVRILQPNQNELVWLSELNIFA